MQPARRQVEAVDQPPKVFARSDRPGLDLRHAEADPIRAPLLGLADLEAAAAHPPMGGNNRRLARATGTDGDPIAEHVVGAGLQFISGHQAMVSGKSDPRP